MYKKKLIEVALPLDAINEASVREKSMRHGHPSTLHLWWARRPLATARAVIWASLVDDPSSHPEKFPTAIQQNVERERLFKILNRLVIWENLSDESVLEQAKKEIIDSCNGELPEFLDPFSGGGALPLEAARFGLVAHAHDLNPVALTINKAQLEIPPLFKGKRPVNPEAQRLWPVDKTKTDDFSGITGLSEDVRYYSEELKKNVQDKIGNLYPKIQSSEGDLTPIAWIWARTITCPNPACGYETPLASTFSLAKKRNKAWIHPHLDKENKRFTFTVEKEKSTFPDPKISKGKFRCTHCGEAIPAESIRDQLKNHQGNEVLMAVVAEGKHGRVYLSPNDEQIKAAKVTRPSNHPTGELLGKSADSVPLYGMEDFSDLFSNRQLTMLIAFSEELQKMEKEIEKDAIRAGFKETNQGLEEGGDGAKAYAQAIKTYLAMLIDQLANHSSTVCSWHVNNEQLRNTFSRQAIPMVWDYAEANPFSESTGSYANLMDRFCKAFANIPSETAGIVKQQAAQSEIDLRNLMISTDPPYYDNIEYADLSDYFYIWLRWNLKDVFPKLLSTMQVPKNEELVASPYRHKSKKEAKQFFENGMLEACRQIFKAASNEIPVTIYYAFKQSDTEISKGKASTASSGWETMLTSIIKAGFAITGTWPVRTEMSSRSIAQGTNALASSIVLVCRKRDEWARTIPRRKFVSELKKELKDSFVKLQQSNIAPVDLAQSAIGPGMGVFSKYKAVLESDGTPMTVRSALEIINQEVDLFFNEQDSDLHAEDRFCVDLYTQCGFDSIKYGEADTLARAKNTSVEKLAHSGAVFAEKGVVHLIDRDQLDKKEDNASPLWVLTQQLVRAMDKDGVDGAAKFLKEVHGRHESMKSLAYRLFTIAEKKNWAPEAYVYNNLVVAWPEIQDRLAELNSNSYETQTLF